MRLLTALCLAFSFGCAVQAGPVKWDICGWEGGVAAEITVMEIGARLGCTNPQAAEVEEVADDE